LVSSPPTPWVVSPALRPTPKEGMDTRIPLRSKAAVKPLE
jgi:hypothetical protein